MQAAPEPILLAQVISDPRCPACGADEARGFFSSQLGWSVRSDAVPLPVSAATEECIRCGHVFKEAADARRWSDYEAYEAYDDDPTRDKLDFGRRVPVTRSAALLAHLRDEGLLTPDTAVLDYGCHRGALLALLGGGEHAGFDVSERYRPVIESLGFSYHTGRHPPPQARFDLLTLVHVAEHLVDPPADLEAGLRALRPDGRVVIQVPDLQSQPTDLYVMDHRSHFSADGLDRAMARVGLIPARPTRSVIPGELTGIYRRPSGLPAARPPQPATDASSSREVLQRGESRLREAMRLGDDCAIFGAGLLGAMIARLLDSRVKYVVDDNTGRHGSLLDGVPVVPLSAVPVGHVLIVVAVPPAASDRVVRRCRGAGHRVLAPFTLDRT